MNYLFGRPVKPSSPSRTGPCELFVLGAYPSALYVAWDSPNQDWRIRAVAVDDEPEPFWNGSDEQERVARWSREVGFGERWGGIAPCGKLNGSSGVWVDERILRPLSSSRRAAWITDCIDTYFESAAAAARLAEPAIVALLAELGIPQRRHRPHPSEDAIVREAIADHSVRLVAELHEASPVRVVTLGNAALRVFASLANTDSRPPRQLDASPSSYGRPISALVGGRTMEWLPLAHPAAPRVYQEAHERWVEQHAGT